MKLVKDRSLAALRNILLQEDEKKRIRLESELQKIKQHISDKEAMLATLEPIILDLLERKILQSREEMAEAFAPMMGEAIKKRIADAREEIIDVLYPIIGKTIKKSIAEAMKKLVDSINQKIEQTLRNRFFAKRMQSRIAGVSEKELILRDAMPFKIEEIFLIHKSSGLLMTHVSSSHPEITVDQELIGGMLTAIKDFVAEAFQSDASQDLNEIQYGDSKIILEMGRYSYIAVVISGIAPVNFRDELQKLDRKVYNRFHPQLREFDGDKSQFAEAYTLLKKFLLSYAVAQQKASASEPKPYFIYLLAAILLIATFSLLVFKLPHYLDERKFLKQVKSQVESLPALKNQKINYNISDDKLTLTGEVPTFSVIAEVDRALQAINEKTVYNRLTVAASPQTNEYLLDQIRKKMSQHDALASLKLEFIIQGDQVVIEGEASSLAQKREIGFLVSEIEGVRIICNNIQITDIQKLRTFLQNQIIYFGVSGTTIDEDQIAKLNAVFQSLQGHEEVTVKINGYSDNSADSVFNATLSQARAQAVADYLVNKGLPADRIVTGFYGEKEPLASNSTDEGRAQNRRVQFDIFE